MVSEIGEDITHSSTTRISKLAVVHTMSPRDPKNWSGTPSNLSEAFEQIGVTTLPVIGGPTRAVEKFIYRVLQKLRGSDYTFSSLFRYYAGRKVANEVAGLTLDAALHFGTTSLLPRNGSRLPQYLYCDSTWDRLASLNPELRIPVELKGSVDAQERSAYARFRHIFCLSDAVRDNLIAHYAVESDHVSVVGSGRGKIAPYYGEKDYSRPTVLFVAKAGFEQKGGRLLLDAFRICAERMRNLSLVMVTAPEAAEYARGIPRVRILGFLPWVELQRLFHSASLFAMPALFEPWGLVYLEAMAARMPVLALNRNAMPQITQNGRYGFLVEQATPEALAEALLYAMSDVDRLRHMGEEAQQYCLATYTWTNVARAMLRIMERDALHDQVETLKKKR